MDEFSHYTKQSKYSDPGKYAYLFDSFTSDISQICNIVHNLVVHQDSTEDLYGFKVPTEKSGQSNTRFIEKVLEIIIENKNIPLKSPRKPEDRFIGSCRDFALLTCAILRHKDIPARVRCGFAAYFHQDWYADHWVCEYYDSQNEEWKLVDAELGEEEKQKYQIEFDPLNIPRELFLVGGKAWQMARKGELDPERTGVKEIGVKGFWFIKADVIRDLAALNKVELLPWDYTEYIDNPFKSIDEVSTEELNIIDSLAALTSQQGPDLINLMNSYTKNSQFRVSGQVKSYTQRGPVTTSI